jgi:peptidoglycan/xylan/chitin deacetylase (PgdA/CDA1 family)
MKQRRNKKRYRRNRRVGFAFLVIFLFFLSSMAGFKIAEKSNDIQEKKIAASNNKSADKKTTPAKIKAAKKKVNSSSSEALGKLPSLPKDAKVAYLTFDDGPSSNVTPRILDILKQNNIKATFFVIGSSVKENPDILRREEKEGHTIGNHTYTHDYEYIYSSVDNFLNDLKRNESVISSKISHHDSKLIRFPGGSFGRTTFQQAAENEGYHYIDWNVLNGDAEVQHSSKDRLVARFRETFLGQKKVVVLMHDAATKETTAEALPEIIQILKDNGYQFRPITEESYNVLK